MSQISIPTVAFFPLDDQPAQVDPSVLFDAPRIPPELYIDDVHHDAIYCPDCGVKCSRKPRKTPRRVDLVDAFYFHMPGFDDVGCPHRKPRGNGGGDGLGKEKKAVNLVTFAGWKELEGEEVEDDDEIGRSEKPKRVVQGGATGGGNGYELIFDENGSHLNSGQFHTVRRLVMLAQKSLNIYVQFDDQDATRLADLILSVEKLQKNSADYIGKNFLLFGQPTSIKSGAARVFLNFLSPEHELSVHCDPRIFQRQGWKLYDRSHFYVFYGLIVGTEARTIIRILEPGQIDRVPSTAHALFNKLR